MNKRGQCASLVHLYALLTTHRFAFSTIKTHKSYRFGLIKLPGPQKTVKLNNFLVIYVYICKNLITDKNNIHSETL